jgi:exodeoxyribonuclease X
MSVLRVIDIETTGWAPPAEIIEVGHMDLIQTPNGGWEIGNGGSSLYRALRGITPETMAVHHITEEMVESAEVCSPLNLRTALMQGIEPDVFVAHNCAFERVFIEDDATGGRPWICTQKCALRVWPEAVGHSNQVLRYWLGLSLDVERAMPPHRALPDAFVTAHILKRLLEGAPVEQLIAWTAEPKFLPRMPFGKHKNARWGDIPTDYLSWMTRQTDMDADVVWCAQQELAHR